VFDGHCLLRKERGRLKQRFSNTVEQHIGDTSKTDTGEDCYEKYGEYITKTEIILKEEEKKSQGHSH
jgi:intergrase/recombinase